MIEQFDVRHFVLDKNYKDNGNTPRGFGINLAIGEEYDAIFLLDADNWFEENHIYKCISEANLSALEGIKLDYITTKRIFRRPDETILEWDDAEDHVDTSCYCLFPGSYSELSSMAIDAKKIISNLRQSVFKNATIKQKDR